VNRKKGAHRRLTACSKSGARASRGRKDGGGMNARQTNCFQIPMRLRKGNHAPEILGPCVGESRSLSTILTVKQVTDLQFGRPVWHASVALLE